MKRSIVRNGSVAAEKAPAPARMAVGDSCPQQDSIPAQTPKPLAARRMQVSQSRRIWGGGLFTHDGAFLDASLMERTASTEDTAGLWTAERSPSQAVVLGGRRRSTSRVATWLAWITSSVLQRPRRETVSTWVCTQKSPRCNLGAFSFLVASAQNRQSQDAAEPESGA